MPSGCPMCGGTDFDGRTNVLMGERTVVYAPAEALFRRWSGLDVVARACLNCGYIALFVADVETLRSQTEQEP